LGFPNVKSCLGYSGHDFEIALDADQGRPDCRRSENSLGLESRTKNENGAGQNDGAVSSLLIS
jgi:hypothetical protein